MTAPKVYVAGISGGKDSTAMSLHLKEQGIEHRRIFYDTGWEHEATYAHLDRLQEHLGPIEIRARYPQLDERREAMALELEAVLGRRSAMVRWVLKRGMFPSRTRRFCTQELKVFVARDALREVHAAGGLPINVVGIRAAESGARAKLEEHELSTSLDCLIWRPLIRWSTADVVAIHQRHGVPPNPLYLQGAGRVGCWPCIQASKVELRMVAKDDARVAVIERLEAMVTELARERDPAAARRAFYQGNRNHRIPGQKGIYIDNGSGTGCLEWGMCDAGTGTEQE